MSKPRDIIWICERCKAQYRQAAGGVAPPKYCFCGGTVKVKA